MVSIGKKDPQLSSESTSCCGTSGCCGPVPPVPAVEDSASHLTRREFLTRSGAASLSLLLAGLPRWAAGSGEIRKSPHLIPKDKNLPAGWLKDLHAPDTAPWSGNELDTIGMPVGGIGAGQLYVCGDGTLGLWEIFNEHEVPPHGLPSYVRRTIPKPVNHGLAIYCEQDGEIRTSRLDKSGFTDVSFRNNHPIATISYSGGAACEAATLECFSPFIPLNAADSGLPATVMVLTIENKGTSDINIGTASWIENVIGKKAAVNGLVDTRSNAVIADSHGGRVVMSAQGRQVKSSESPREPIVFQDFEGPGFGDWKVEGTAFGDGPTTGNLPTQLGVKGFEGKGFAGSFRDRDSSTGKLLSPEFVISRRYINFLIGGGNQPGRQGINLKINGEIARSATGKNNEALSWQSWEVSSLVGQTARLEILDGSADGWGHIQVDHIEFSDVRRTGDGPDSFEKFPDAGTMAWAVAEPVESSENAKAIFKALALPDMEIFTETGMAPYSPEESKTTGLATRPVTISPGASHTFVHLLTWHFPNTVLPNAEAGHYYAARYADANAVMDYLLENRDRLINETRAWRDTYYDSTLPRWLLERVHMTSCCLATGTTMWWKSGRFWAWEGVTCCEGTCTHVYNYVQTVARLFPELERNLREQQDLKAGVGLEPSGLVGFRHDGKYAADGQCGTVLKVFREHQMSADDAFLRRNWDATKMVLDYAIGQDGNGDGILEGMQHNTYDVNFYGPNTFVGALYLAALRAGEEMAREMGENAYADKLRGIFEKGKSFAEEHLWNGEFFYQQVDLKAHPEHQYGPGCLSDQLFGQNWAHQLGLGYLYDPTKVRRALQSVWDYNWAPDLGPYNAVYPAQRIFAEAAEAGLFNCTWPGSKHLDDGVLYRDEVWSGVEYQVASHMIYEDMITEGLAMTRAVHDRYTPGRRNPYNEIECSDYYSRAMASWVMLMALSGYFYHGPKQHLGFDPKITPDNFRCAFNAAEGWGTFSQKGVNGKRQWDVKVSHGSLSLKTMSLPASQSGSKFSAAVADAPLSGVDQKVTGKTVELTFSNPVHLQTGQSLTIMETV